MTAARETHVLSYPLPPAWDSAINGWLAWLIAAGTSSATRHTRRGHVRRVAREVGAASPRDVTGPDLLAILGRADYSIEHRRGLRASLASFYHWCLTSGVVESDPTLTLPMVRTPSGAPKPATDEIWRQILAAADERSLLMARLACEAGLRRAEVACVHSDDLANGIDGAELIVHGKGGKQRVVPITVTLAADIAATCPHGGFLFPGQIDGHLSANHVGKIVSALMPHGWSMHKLRHRFATRGYAGTGNLRAVQEALGHASVATTQRYTAVAGADLRRVSEAAAGGSPAPEKPAVNPPRTMDVSETAAGAPPQEAPKVTGDFDTSTTEISFESVISGWAEAVRCEVATLAVQEGTLTTHQGAPCQRRAGWRLNLHSCRRLLMCSRDMQAWKRHLLEALRSGRMLECVYCGRSFECFDDACTVTRL